MQGFKIAERLLQPGRHQKAPVWRKLAHEKLEHGRFRLAVVQIGLHHIELIEIG